MSIESVTRRPVLSLRIAFCAIFGGLVLAPAAASAAPACGAPVDTGSRMQVFCGFTGGEQEFVVPAGVASLRVSASGATGGGAVANPYYGGTKPGAVGATAAGDLPVTPGSTLYVNVGGAVGRAAAASTAAAPPARTVPAVAVGPRTSGRAPP